MRHIARVGQNGTTRTSRHARHVFISLQCARSIGASAVLTN